MPHLRPIIILAFFSTLSCGSGEVAGADISVGIQIGVPEGLVFEAPPAMVWVPEIGVYVAFNSPYRLFFYAGEYYLFDQGHWFMAPGYGGPWLRIEIARLPRHLQRYHDKEWQRYQERADIYYRRGYRHEHPYFPAWSEKRWENDPHERGERMGRDQNKERGEGGGRDHQQERRRD